jgi:REP element-mobilizing transposase RayT
MHRPVSPAILWGLMQLIGRLITAISSLVSFDKRASVQRSTFRESAKEMHSQYPNRQTVRLQQYDYGSTNAYFITACAQNHACVFGDIKNGIMCLNALGARVWEEWFKTFEKRPEFSPGAFTVMPNHWHGIVHIIRQDGDHWNEERIEAFGGSKKDTLATMLKGMKSAVTSFAINELDWNGKLWQRGFHDHVIRNREEYERIEAYILNNTRKWNNDCFYP